VLWSPDSKYLLVNLGFDSVVPMYAPEINVIELATGETVLTRKHTNGSQDVHANAIGWMNDSKRFVTAPADGLLCIWNLEGEIVKVIDIDDSDSEAESKSNVEAMIMIRGRDAAIIADNYHKIRVISFEDEESK